MYTPPPAQVHPPQQVNPGSFLKGAQGPGAMQPSGPGGMAPPAPAPPPAQPQQQAPKPPAPAPQQQSQPAPQAQPYSAPMPAQPNMPQAGPQAGGAGLSVQTGPGQFQPFGQPNAKGVIQSPPQAQSTPGVGQQVSGTGFLSPFGPQPTINATSVYTPQQQQQLVNQAVNQNARTAAGANQQAAMNFGGAGFAAAGSPAMAAIQNQNAAQQMMANTQAMTNIPLQTGAANAQQLLAGQNAQQNQYNQGIQNWLGNQGQQLGFLGGLMGSILNG